MSDGETRLQRDGQVARVTFDRPAARNAMTWRMYEQLGAICGELKNEGVLAHIIFNAYWEPLDFELPVLEQGSRPWFRWIDTALDPPLEICDWNAEEPVLDSIYHVGARSVVVLIAGEGVHRNHVCR